MSGNRTPPRDGGSPITGYTATADPGGATCTTDGDGRTCEITGLTNGTAYTFTVTATNAIGTSTDCTPTNVTPAAVPGQPRSATAQPGFRQASVTWSPPNTNGGSDITSYTVTSSPGGRTCNTVNTECAVTGLEDFTAYTFTIAATNSVGDSPNATTPQITLSGDEVTAALAAPSEADTDTPIILDARDSTSLSGSIAEYEWDFGDGQYTQGPSVSQHAWRQPGTQAVPFRVSSLRA